MTTQQITTSPGGYEAHDQRKREWLRAPPADRARWADAAAQRRQTNERLREEMHAQGWAAGSFADSVRMDWALGEVDARTGDVLYGGCRYRKG